MRYRSIPDEAFQFLPTLKMEQLAERFSEDYKASGEPYPHVVIDELFDPSVLDRVIDDFPDRSVMEHWDSRREDKFTSDGEIGLSAYTRAFLHSLNSKPFLVFIEKITGISGLVADPEPGVHEVLRDGYLGVHVDYNKDERTGLDRRINLLIYLNHDWQDEWGGGIELWDAGAERCVKKVPPVFNRMVIFPVHDQAYHGHPDPMTCPKTRSRKALHVSYYTVGRPEADNTLMGSYFPGEKSGKYTRQQLFRRFVPPIVVDACRKAGLSI